MHFIEPFEILEHVGKVTYRFPHQYVKKCVHNPLHDIDFDDTEVNDNMTYNEGPVRVLDHEVKKRRKKEIPLAKIQWKHYDEREASWELESEMHEKFLYLFGCCLTQISRTRSFVRWWII